MNLISDRTALINTENAFKVGPYIAAIENAGQGVIKPVTLGVHRGASADVSVHLALVDLQSHCGADTVLAQSNTAGCCGHLHVVHR